MSSSPLNITDSRKFCSSVLEGIAEGIVVIGLDKKIVFINKMAFPGTFYMVITRLLKMMSSFQY